MRPADKIEFITLQKLVQNVRTKKVTNASFLVLVPAFLFLNRIRPEQVAEHTLTRYLCRSVQGKDLLDFSQFGADTSVHANYLFFNYGSNWHSVKRINESFP